VDVPFPSGGFGGGGSYHGLPEDEAQEVLANVVLSHVPVENFDFQARPCTLATLCDVSLWYAEENAVRRQGLCRTRKRPGWPEFAQSLV
jgi:hypothetical protein